MSRAGQSLLINNNYAELYKLRIWKYVTIILNTATRIILLFKVIILLNLQQLRLVFQFFVTWRTKMTDNNIVHNI